MREIRRRMTWKREKENIDMKERDKREREKERDEVDRDTERRDTRGEKQGEN
jgi:hypothetical protein